MIRAALWAWPNGQAATPNRSPIKPATRPHTSPVAPFAPVAFSVRVARAVGMACALGALSGCSVLSLTYPRLPDLTVWWVQRQVSLDGAQSAQLRQDAQSVLDWHRQTQLAAVTDVLQHWQTLVNQPLTPKQVCTEFAKVRQQWDAIVSQSTAGMLTIGRSLTPAQRDELAASQAKAHATFRQTYLTLSTPTPTNWLPTAWTSTTGADSRLKSLGERYARLYGPMTAAQTDALRQSIARSSFDPARTLAERERRTQDLLATLRQTTTDAGGLQHVRDWVSRLTQSPTPGYAAYSQTLVREACEQLAQVHALATPAQKTHARTVLAGYEADLRQLTVGR